MRAFDKTLIKDPKTGIAIKAPLDVVDFYEMALGPVVDAQAATAEAKAQADKLAKEEAAKNAKLGQRERGDIAPSGKPNSNLSQADQEWLEAIKEYEES